MRFPLLRAVLAAMSPTKTIDQVRKHADQVIIDQVTLECRMCSKVRTFDHDPPLRGGEALRDFMWSAPACECGHSLADVKCRLVEAITQVAHHMTVKA